MWHFQFSIFTWILNIEIFLNIEYFSVVVNWWDNGAGGFYFTEHDETRDMLEQGCFDRGSPEFLHCYNP